MEFGKEMVQETEKSERLKEICSIISEALKTQHGISIDAEDLISCIKKHNERNGYAFGQVCKDAKTVSILGTEYTVEVQSENQNPKLKDCNGLCEWYSKRIMLNDLAEQKQDVMCVENVEEFEKKVLRHEVFHAFFGESGMRSHCDFAEDEMLIDWLAIQSPKIFKVLQELDAL